MNMKSQDKFVVEPVVRQKFTFLRRNTSVGILAKYNLLQKLIFRAV
jgi:hypothetical protein